MSRAKGPKRSSATRARVRAGRGRLRRVVTFAEPRGSRICGVRAIDELKPQTGGCRKVFCHPGLDPGTAFFNGSFSKPKSSARSRHVGFSLWTRSYFQARGHRLMRFSRKMADSVVRYLVENHEIPVYRIYVVGMGNAPAPTSADETGAKPKRMSGGRVEVSLMKNDLEQLASSSNATTDVNQAK